MAFLSLSFSFKKLHSESRLGTSGQWANREMEEGREPPPSTCAIFGGIRDTVRARKKINVSQEKKTSCVFFL